MKNPQRLVNEEKIRDPYKRERLGILVGVLLGNSVIKNGRVLTIMHLHSIDTLDYFKWKGDVLSSIGMSRGKILKQEQPGQLSTVPSCDLFSDKVGWFYEKMFRGGIITAQPQVIRHLNYYGLAIWLMDSGINLGDEQALNIEKFDDTSAKNLQNMLRRRFCLNSEIFKDEWCKKYLHFDGKDAHHLRSLVSPYIHPLMRYKVC